MWRGLPLKEQTWSCWESGGRWARAERRLQLRLQELLAGLASCDFQACNDWEGTGSQEGRDGRTRERGRRDGDVRGQRGGGSQTLHFTLDQNVCQQWNAEQAAGPRRPASLQVCIQLC